MVKTLTELKPEESGTVIEIRGGQGLVNRLNAMGVVRGKKITVVSCMMLWLED
jgi:Fe2+ transport system protein FeoA